MSFSTWEKRIDFLVFQLLATRKVPNQRGLCNPFPPLFLPRHSPRAGITASGPRTDLHGQADGVEQDEDKHQVLKVGGVDHVPHFVLVLVLGYVPPQGPGFEGIFHTLSLGGRQREGAGRGESVVIYRDDVCEVAEEGGILMKPWG